jgi:hypothetical protein
MTFARLIATSREGQVENTVRPEIHKFVVCEIYIEFYLMHGWKQKVAKESEALKFLSNSLVFRVS